MKHKNSHLLVGYWSRIRRGRDVPDQTDIDPRAIKRLLSYAFILDCENPTRPVYRLGGTALCERFGLELKGTGFLSHWDARSALSLAGLLRQSLNTRKPLCLSSVAVTAGHDATELETILTPVSFNGGAPRRFFGLVQMLSDPTPLIGRVIAYEKLVASRLVEEDEPRHDEDNLPPPPTTRVVLRSHPKAPYLGLVVSEDQPSLSAFAAGDFLQDIFDRLSNAANATEQPRFGV
ncbi:MAG TPA: PAS domain-containing protein [Rhizomicrobium sp.]|nr:PAS domain-containing protein [Rhizomicrobium sp.]